MRENPHDAPHSWISVRSGETGAQLRARDIFFCGGNEQTFEEDFLNLFMRHSSR
jgi:hypothetical protein